MENISTDFSNLQVDTEIIYNCDFKGCNFISTLTTHKCIHEKEFYYCNYPSCRYKSIQWHNLKRHKKLSEI